MQAAAGVPVAAPPTVTPCTRPSEPKTTVAFDGRSCPLTHDRAPPITEPSAACTAPVDGFSGRPVRPSAGLSGGSAGAIPWDSAGAGLGALGEGDSGSRLYIGARLLTPRGISAIFDSGDSG